MGETKWTNRSVILTVWLLAICLLFAGCGPSENSAGTTTGGAETAATFDNSITTDETDDSGIGTDITGGTSAAGHTTGIPENKTGNAVTPPTTKNTGISTAAQIKVPKSFSIDDPTYINSFSKLVPAAKYIISESWMASGYDSVSDTVFVGFTAKRPDMLNAKSEQIEDFALFAYSPTGGTVIFIDSFIEASKRAGNYLENEEIPKGHTKLVVVDGKVYMGSQSFHDFKEKSVADATLSDYRGAHLYCYDIAKKTLTDLSQSMSGGVVLKNEGIIALSYMPSRRLLVGLTHPRSNLIFIHVDTHKVVRNATGIPWANKGENYVSREVVVSGDRVYMARGTECYWIPSTYTDSFYVYYHDYAANKTVKTSEQYNGGFWNGQATTKDGRYTYISTVYGQLYRLDNKSYAFNWVGDMNPGNTDIIALYSISLSPDDKRVFYIPSFYPTAGLAEFNLETKQVKFLKTGLHDGIYTGNSIVDKHGNYYFVHFGSNNPMQYSGNCELTRFKVTANY